jgi:hypothetical protein
MSLNPGAIAAFALKVGLHLPLPSATKASIAEYAQRVGLDIPPPPPSRSDLAAFEHHLQSLATPGPSLSPKNTRSLLNFSLDSLACRRSQASAVSIANAYGVEVHFVPDSDPRLNDSLTLGFYRPARYTPGPPGLPGAGSLLEPDSIVIRASSSPEKRISTLWHELGHLVLGHNAPNVLGYHDPDRPPDLHSTSLGWRSEEYLANAFASIIIQETIPGPHPLHEALSRSYVETFESLLAVVLYERDPSGPYDAATGTSRAQALLAANRDSLLSTVAFVKQVGRGLSLAYHLDSPTVIPPGQEVHWNPPPELPPPPPNPPFSSPSEIPSAPSLL